MEDLASAGVREGDGLEAIPVDLSAAFWRYEDALASNDADTLHHMFSAAPDTLRADAAGVLVGADQIDRFRRLRASPPARGVVSLHATRLRSDCYVLTAETFAPDRGRGIQTQVWQRHRGTWKIRAGHVSSPAALVDRATWRVHGAPLVAARRSGLLGGERAAVKDMFAIEGFRIAAGVPALLDESTPASAHAAEVDLLLDAGCAVVGIAHCDELAFGLEGANPHSGTSRNVRAADRLPGGSSSGVASAVAGGEATIGLGTDTAGSIRVPASYQGLWGLRATHGAIDVRGMRALAPSFDTVGWISAGPELLSRVLAVHGMTAREGEISSELVTIPWLVAATDAEAADSFRALHPDAVPMLHDAAADFEGWFGAFRLVQSAEAWRQHGDWIERHPGAVSHAVEARFRAGSSIDDETMSAARRILDRARTRVADELGDRILVLPTAPGPAPRLGAQDEQRRVRTLQLGAIAAIAGLPALSAPVLEVAGLPVGVTYLGTRGTDAELVRAVSDLSSRHPRPEVAHAHAA